MHTGGGHIDAYLVMALPFIAMLFLYSSHKFLSSMIGIGIFITGLYVLLVTFSRGLYLAFAVAFIVFIIGLLIALHSKRSNDKGKWMPLLGFMLLLPAITIPVLQGGFIQERFNRIDQDLDVRMQHWQEVLDMREDDLSTTLFGMGVGSYPRTYFWSHSGVGGMPATYTIKTGNDNRYLSLGSGGSLYLDQYVSIEPGTEYRLAAELRAGSGHGSITIPICEKSLLYSFRCVWKTLQVDSEPGEWARAEKTINTQYVGTSLGKTMGELSRRPVKLGVYNRNKSEVIDIDNISLTDSAGNNLLSNGDFSEGTDFWFFTIDNHQALNIDNFWVHVFFDQGWIGAATLLLLLVFVLYRLIKRLKKGDYFAVILLTSVLGFFIIGTVGSPFEAPKLGLLYFLIVFLSLSEDSKNQRRKRNHSIH